MKNRNIALSIVFSLISCGIYCLYWMYRLIIESNELTGNTEDMSPVLVIVLGMVTCGIFWWIWLYKCGKRFDEKNGTNNAILFLILAICGLSIVDMALIQKEINAVTPAE